MCSKMCYAFVVVKTMFVCVAVFGYMTGKQTIVIPMNKLTPELPEMKLEMPHFLGYSAREIPRDEDFVFEYGSLVRLENGTCDTCMGSPNTRNSHLAVTFETENGFPDTCTLAETNTSFCFRLRKTDVLVIFTPGPPKGIFKTYSWVPVLFDIAGQSGRRYIVQTPLYDPLELEPDHPVIMIFGFIPDFVNDIKEKLSKVGVNVHIMPIPIDLVKTDGGIYSDDRISVLMKSVPVEGTVPDYDYIMKNSKVYMIRVKESHHVESLREMDVYRKGHRISAVDGIRYSESEYYAEKMASLASKWNAEITYKMVNLRKVLDLYSPEKCVKAGINCLAEDWNLHYTVSNKLVFLPNHTTIIIGVNHPQASFVTVSLFHPDTGAEIVNLQFSPDMSGIYTLVLRDDCNGYGPNCKKVSIGPYFLRERAYGIDSDASDLLPPIILRLGTFISSMNVA